MGARAVVELTGDEELKDRIAGGLCLSYPLHKSRDASDLRTSGFPDIKARMFFASGTQDDLCQQTVMKQSLKLIPRNVNVEMKWVEGANHSGMPKRRRKADFEVPDYFHSIVAWACELAKKSFDPDLATNNSPGKKPVAALLAKRKRDAGDDPAAKKAFDNIEAVLCRPTNESS